MTGNSERAKPTDILLPLAEAEKDIVLDLLYAALESKSLSKEDKSLIFGVVKRLDDNLEEVK